ncbi:MAG: tripartite tricarboxylate transporter TctB family protein [Proteobacteria bacterium]|jgi:putative tricarboxylic transport membrane protein|nr:tripartite tricarboxylate transporter TctB family protein [Pseudomonadota bacterium]
MPLHGASERLIMKKKLYIIPLFLTLFSLVVIYLSLQLETSPQMIVGDSMQARSFPIFLMILNLILTGILSYQFSKTYPKEVKLEKFPTWSSILLFLLFYILVTISGDLFVAIPVVMFLMGIVWGQKKLWVALTNAIVTPLSIFLLFDYVLQVRFPRGWLTNIYYG